MIKVSRLDKSFGEVHALNSVSMAVKKGSIYGLVGTNGSGKTTILKHITGILKADSGRITIADQPVFNNPQIKERIAFIPDDLFFFGNYNLKDMAKMYRGLYPDWNQERFQSIVDNFGLKMGSKIMRFSKGMQKQAAFALCMASMPDYLILDEPVDGLDPLARRTVWDIIINDCAEREMTVLISSHNLKEIEGICDTVGILSNGNMVLERELDDLRSNVHKIQVAFTERPENPYEDLSILSKQQIGSIDMLIVKNSAEEIEEALEQYSPVVLDILPLTLEEIFIYELGGEKNEFKDILS